MPFTVTMPKLSPTMEEGTIAKWHVKEGEFVKADQLLIEVATDKATVEYNALDAGWLRKILIVEGGSAQVNQAIAVFTEKQHDPIDHYQPEGLAPAKPEAPKAEAAQAIQETANEVKSPKAASLQQPAFVPEAPLKDYHFERPLEKEKRVKASPLARKLAEERHLDLSSVRGSGPGERIVSKDLELAQSASTTAFSTRQQPEIAPGTYEEEPLSSMRKVIGQRLQESKSFIPHFYVQQAVNAQPLIALREQLSHMEFKISVNDLVVRATALALKKHPNINSGFNSVNQALIRFKTIDIAIAVSVGGGLITPIVRHADYKSVGEISTEIRALAKRAKEGKLEAHEYKGGSFTISNLGMFGITDFHAIINPPQAAILAVSGVQEIPVVKGGQIVPGKVLNVTLSADHRVIDGVAAAEFIKTVQTFLENPAILLV